MPSKGKAKAPSSTLGSAKRKRKRKKGNKGRREGGREGRRKGRKEGTIQYHSWMFQNTLELLAHLCSLQHYSQQLSFGNNPDAP
jgi:hypothetical protein